jgi:hypothetical protein
MHMHAPTRYTHGHTPHTYTRNGRPHARMLYGDEGPCLGALDQGAECGVEHSTTSAATFAHTVRRPYTLGAEIHGAETCYLGATVHDAEVRVHFLKSFQNRCSCENLSRKWSKSKKKSASLCPAAASAPTQHRRLCVCAIFGLRDVVPPRLSRCRQEPHLTPWAASLLHVD